MTTPVMCTQPSSPDPRFLAGLPHRSRLELGAYETAPRTARGHIARVLEEWSLPEFCEVAVLIATELTTNSVLETGKYAWAIRPPVRLWLRGGPPGVAILIWDAIAAPPAPRTAGDTDETGRGLAIVAAFSAACGCYPCADPAGKVTWSLITSPLAASGQSRRAAINLQTRQVGTLRTGRRNDGRYMAFVGAASMQSQRRTSGAGRVVSAWHAE